MFPWYFQKRLGPPIHFQTSQPRHTNHAQSQLSKSMGYEKHDISKTIGIEDSSNIDNIDNRVTLIGVLCNEPLSTLADPDLAERGGGCLGILIKR